MLLEILNFTGIGMIVFAAVAWITRNIPFKDGIPIFGDVMNWAAGMFPWLIGFGVFIQVLISTRGAASMLHWAVIAGVLGGVGAWVITFFG